MATTMRSMPGLVLLLLLLVPAALSNPIASASTAYATVLQEARCGQIAEVMIEVTDQIQLTSRYLLDSVNNTLPANCDVAWRIDVQASGLENFGLQVTGVVELEDPKNNRRCSSSKVLITDRDESGDITAVTQSVCGKKRVSYMTYQDTVTVHLSTSDTGAIGRGFALNFSPVYACGGVIEGPVGTSTVIQTPRYPMPYPLDLFCVWDVEAPPESWVRVECQHFSLPSRRGGNCGDYLMLQQMGQISPFCGEELLGQQRAVTVENNEALLIFRSAGRYNLSPGFVCSVDFIEPNTE